jgi:hypothetical protein
MASDGEVTAADKLLLAPRTVVLGKQIIDLEFQNKPLSAGLCGFGIAFVAFGAGMYLVDPPAFGITFLITLVAFSSLLVILGVVAAARHLHFDPQSPDATSLDGSRDTKQLEPAIASILIANDVLAKSRQLRDSGALTSKDLAEVTEIVVARVSSGVITDR